MSTSALSGVMDYLLAQFGTALHNVDPDGVIDEGIPTFVPPAPHPLLIVGMPHPEDATAADGLRNYFALGSGGFEEEFEVPCYIDVGVAGPLEQGTARRSALLVFDGCVDAIRADLTLGGLLKKGRWAEIPTSQLVATRDEQEATKGRRSILSFRVKCRNFY